MTRHYVCLYKAGSNCDAYTYMYSFWVLTQPCIVSSTLALGCSQRLGGCHPFHYECVAGLPHLLADFQYHGRQPVCGEVLLLLQRNS